MEEFLVGNPLLHKLDYTILLFCFQGLEDLTKDFEKRTQKLVFLNVSTKIIAVLEPLTTINPNTYHCQSETEMLDVLFMMKADEVLRMETVPLLSDSFRKKDSICSENYLYDLNEHRVHQEKVSIEPIKEEHQDKKEVKTERKVNREVSVLQLEKNDLRNNGNNSAETNSNDKENK